MHILSAWSLTSAAHLAGRDWSYLLLGAPIRLSVRMEMDRIRTDTDSDISDNHICVSFQFPSLRMEMDRIRMDTNSDISDIFGYLFIFLFPYRLHPYLSEIG